LKNNSIKYFFSILIVIITGIASRKIGGIPTYFGDILYAIMIYLGTRLVFINFNSKKSAILALIFCFSVEFLQLYRAEWIVELRKTSLGHYALGEEFIWSDLALYTIGVAVAIYLDLKFICKK
jgi:hypothetical protein